MDEDTALAKVMLRQSALFSTLAAGVLYLAGHLYLSSFYGYLGIMDTRIPTDVPYVMTASFLPLIAPAFFLVILVASSFRFRRRASERSWFFPLPAAEAFAIVFTIWLLKILTDLQQTAADVQWLGYARRDVIFFVLGVASISARWLVLLRAWKGPRRLSPWTFMLGAWITAWLGVAVGLSILLGEWRFSWWQTLLFVGGGCYVVYLAIRDWRRGRPEILPAPPARQQPRVMLWLWVAMTLLLSVSLTGSVHAKEAAEGCSNIKTVAFSPQLEGDDENRTYWLVLHDDARVFIRPLPPDEGRTRMVLEDAGREVILANQAAIRRC